MEWTIQRDSLKTTPQRTRHFYTHIPSLQFCAAVVVLGVGRVWDRTDDPLPPNHTTFEPSETHYGAPSTPLPFSPAQSPPRPSPARGGCQYRRRHRTSPPYPTRAGWGSFRWSYHLHRAEKASLFRKCSLHVDPRYSALCPVPCALHSVTCILGNGHVAFRAGSRGGVSHMLMGWGGMGWAFELV